ncbi:MAG: transglycosylase SLT domain-containing protein [Alphaproteobacteria bacterium]|nr:transglycosylase SLT domain-containing protein [Alphaproteobacteria bacterium]
MLSARFLPILIATQIAIAALLPAAVRAAPSAPVTPEAHGLCVAATRQAEIDNHLPPHLLAAISLAETGRWSGRHRASFAWPWTVMAEGIGRYLPTREAAIAEVKGLQARGVTNIDVGCMQVNLFYHGDAFRSLEEAFDPETNAEYAAAFLADLNRETKNWAKAVANYHSRDQDRGAYYQGKVYDLWYGQRDHLVASAEGGKFVHSKVARQRAAERQAARETREKQADLQRIRAAARAANVAFLKKQAALTEARHMAAFEMRKAKALAEFRERKAKREAAQRGG